MFLAFTFSLSLNISIKHLILFLKVLYFYVVTDFMLFIICNLLKLCFSFIFYYELNLFIYSASQLLVSLPSTLLSALTSPHPPNPLLLWSLFPLDIAFDSFSLLSTPEIWESIWKNSRASGTLTCFSGLFPLCY